MTPEAARGLADLGAFALLVLTWSLLAIGFFKRWFVPGYLYDALREDWKVLRDQGDRNSKALELMAKRYESLRRGE